MLGRMESLKASAYQSKKTLKRWWFECQFAFYHLLCKIAWRIRPRKSVALEIRQHAVAFATQGCTILPEEIPAPTIEQIDGKIEQMIAADRPEDVTHFKTFMTEFTTEAVKTRIFSIDEIITPRTAQILELFFGSNFKLIQATCYRTKATEEAPANSWVWHSDNAPQRIYKIMIYLSDTTRESGAFAYHSQEDSRRLAPFFLDRYQTAHIQSELDDPNRYAFAEGKKGTVVLFDNNLIHRGTIPKPGTHRDALFFFVSPSFVPWRDHYRTHGLSSHRNPSWENPFFT